MFGPSLGQAFNLRFHKNDQKVLGLDKFTRHIWILGTQESVMECHQQLDSTIQPRICFSKSRYFPIQIHWFSDCLLNALKRHQCLPMLKSTRYWYDGLFEIRMPSIHWFIMKCPITVARNGSVISDIDIMAIAMGLICFFSMPIIDLHLLNSLPTYQYKCRRNVLPMTSLFCFCLFIKYYSEIIKIYQSVSLIM